MPNIFSQLVSAFKTTGTDQANDTDDAQPPADDLPPYPFASSTPSSPKHQSDTAIDLTSPAASPQKPRESRHVPDHKRSGPGSKRRVSDDEKRLTGDFDVPADRVFAPDPGSYFRAPRPAMGKPGSNTAFKPGLNTIDGPQRAPSRVKHITYGKKPHTYAPGSEAFSPGQAAFDDLHSKSLSTPARSHTSRQNSATQSVRVSPTKRRKTETSTAPQVIELLDDEEIQEVRKPDQPVPSAIRNTRRPPPSISAQSRHGAESRAISREQPAGLTSANEFLGTEALLKSGRRPGEKVLQQDVTRTSSTQEISGYVTPQIHSTIAKPGEDEDMVAALASRRSILKSLKQGVKDDIDDPSKMKETKSPYFGNARINESTMDTKKQTTAAAQGNGTDQTLRNFRRASSANSREPVSDDELGLDMLPSTVAPMKAVPPSRSGRAPNSGARRKSKAHEAAQGWPLTWARSHDFDSETTLNSNTIEHPLILRYSGDLSTLEIALWMDKREDYTIPATIAPKDVNIGQVGDDGRIRLEGPRPREGNQPIFDLAFKSLGDFDDFRDNHLPKYCAGTKVHQKPKEHMDVIFRKPLRKNDKAKTTSLVPDPPLPEAAIRSTRAQAARTSPWDGTRTGTQRTRPATANRGLAATSDVDSQARVSKRPTRATRATAPAHDTSESDHDHEVQRFSVVHGLGTPWVKELTFGEGRQRAQVIFDDLIRLDEEEFLNDNLINFYMTYLFKQSKISPSKVHFFNTFFYNRLKQNTGSESINYEAVKRWTRDDIFLKDYIVIPINEDFHWYLAIICNVRNIDRKAFQEDFDDPGPIKMTDRDGPAPIDTDGPGTEALSISQPVEASDAPATREEPERDHADDDANLFDEESKLNLVDRDAIDAADDHQEITKVELSQKPPTQHGTTRAAPSIFDPPARSKTVLSNLHASPGKRKSKKRRSMAPKRDPKQPVVIILDSLSQTRTPAVRALKDWIAAEGKAKRGMEVDIKEKGLYPKGDQIPTQSNFSDCGVYLLGYAEKFFNDPDEFTRKLLTGEMTPDEDWPQLKPKEMRINLRDIIFAIAAEQELTVPTKKKKAKKSAATEKSSPVKADTEASERGPSTPLLKQPLRSAEDSCAVPPQTTSTVDDSDSLRAQGDSTAAKPRLASPFSFKRTENIASPGKATTRAIRSASPIKTDPMTPHQDRDHGRCTHPKARTPRRASPVKEGREKARTAPGSAAAVGENSLQGGSKARSIGPLKQMTHRIDGVEHGSPPKKSTTSLEGAKREPDAENKSNTRQHPDGHSNHPIEILDSQEASHTTPRSTSRATDSPRTVRKQPSVEIPSFSTQAVESQGQRSEDEFVGSQLVARLDADDAQRAGSVATAAASMQGPATISLERQQSVPDIMEVDSQGNDPMDTAEDGSDAVIRETPEAARRSPSNLSM